MNTDTAKPAKLRVKIHSPFKTYFDGAAFSISAINDTGPFDVLSGHHRFMTILNKGNITVRNNEGGQLVYKIDRGIMHVRDNQVVVFLDV